MVNVVLFLAVFTVSGLMLYFKTRSDITGPYIKEGPGRIADYLRSRNRIVILVILIILIGIAALEMFIPDIHFFVLDIQYAVGSVLQGDPLGILELGSGAGISWGLYLSLLAAVVLGVPIGAWSACKGYGSTQGISVFQLI